MDEGERLFFQEMRANFEKYLAIIDQQILDYLPDGNDEEYDFLIKKAVEFRNLIKATNDKLNQRDT